MSRFEVGVEGRVGGSLLRDRYSLNIKTIRVTITDKEGRIGKQVRYGKRVLREWWVGLEVEEQGTDLGSVRDVVSSL